MRKSLYIKFVISYLILAFIGFFAVSMFGSSMVHNHLDSVYSTSLYQEATNIAQNQASKYYREQASLESVAQNLETLSKYQNVEIWLISKKGEILLNTASDSDDNKLTVIEDFKGRHRQIVDDAVDHVPVLLHRKLGVLVGIVFHKYPPICRPGQGRFSLGQIAPGQPRPVLRRFSSAPGSNGVCRDCRAQAVAHSQTPAVLSMAVCRSNAPTPETIRFQPGRADRS